MIESALDVLQPLLERARHDGRGQLPCSGLAAFTGKSVEILGGGSDAAHARCASSVSRGLRSRAVSAAARPQQPVLEMLQALGQTTRHTNGGIGAGTKA